VYADVTARDREGERKRASEPATYKWNEGQREARRDTEGEKRARPGQADDRESVCAKEKG